MFRLSEIVWQSDLPVERSAGIVSATWQAMYRASVELDPELVRELGLTEEETTLYYRGRFFERWALMELGQDGHRALLFGLARQEDARPKQTDLLGARPTPSDLAKAVVVEMLDIRGAEPLEAVRQSVARFKRRIRDRAAFSLTRGQELRLVPGISILRAYGLGRD